jgi:hypothetical protein
MGWTAARFARRCRIPAVFGVAFTGLWVGAWTIWKESQIVWPESLGYHFSVWTASWPIPLMTVLVLLGGCLANGGDATTENQTRPLLDLTTRTAYCSSEMKRAGSRD